MDSLRLLVTFAVIGSASSCTTSQLRFSIGAAAGGAIGATGGVLFSPPDSQNRLINGLVFGLGSALLGAGIGVFIPVEPKSCTQPLGQKGSTDPRVEYHVNESEALPEFLKSRLSPTVIEQYHERDRIAEDGSLHEPHKVYRVKKPADLITDSGSDTANVKNGNAK